MYDPCRIERGSSRKSRPQCRHVIPRRISRTRECRVSSNFLPNRNRKNDQMATVNHVDPVFYPAFCFKESPTHFAWVKMAATDVQRLQKVRGFEGIVFFCISLFPASLYTM